MTKPTYPAADDEGELSRRRLQLREITSEPQIVGQELCAARLRRGDDLATVSHALRIRKDHLQAVEDSRVEDLPGRTYAIGFVRSYAGYLGLDSAELVDRYKDEIAGRGDGAPQIGWTPDTGGSLPYGWMFMAVIVAAVVVYGGWHLVRSADTYSPQAVAPVPARIASAPGRNPVHRVATQSRHFQAQTSPAGGGASPERTATTIPPAAPVSASTTGMPARNVQTAALPVGQVFGLQNKDSRVILHARAVTRVLVQGPGGRVYINRLLHPGDAYRVPALVGLSLTTPDGGAVALELDGQDMGLAGRSGQMTEALSLDPQAIVDRTARKNPG